MTHVDVIKNELLAGYQTVVARVQADEDGLHIEATGEAERFTEQTVRELFERSGLTPQQFLLSLHEHLRGDYLFASEAHEEAECLCRDTRVALEAAELPELPERRLAAN